MNVSHVEPSAQEPASHPYRDNASLHDLLFLRLLGAGAAIRALLRQEELVTTGTKILDAGCGAGLVTKTLFQQSKRRAVAGASFHCFDRHPELLNRFRKWAEKSGNDSIAIREGNFADLSSLPANWRGYDVIVVSAMLDYVPSERFASMLTALRDRLKQDGRLFLVVTRETPITRRLSRQWWDSNLFTPEAVLDSLAEADFASAQFHGFPGSMRPFTQWILVAEARQKP